MSRPVTLLTLQNRVKQRANVEFASNAALYTAAELTDNINEGLAELYDAIVSIEDQETYLSTVTFQTVANTDTYAIGAGSAINIADFYKLRGVDVMFGQNIVITAKPFMMSERNRYKWYPGWIYSQPVFYRLWGNAIKFIPAPSGTFTITLWYVPIVGPPLAAPTDTFDGIDGMEEYAVLSAAIKLLTKQEQFEHATVLMQERDRQKQRVLDMCAARDTESPPRVQDVLLSGGHTGAAGFGNGSY